MYKDINVLIKTIFNKKEQFDWLDSLGFQTVEKKLVNKNKSVL